MKSNNIVRVSVCVALGAAMLSSCNIYKKFEMPTDNDRTREYVEARDANPDSSAYGNLPWQQVFTDPLLQDYINLALVNNKDLRNAQLNVEVARANRLGARLAYFPSVAFTPNGAGAKYGDFDMSWSYQIPLAISWEVDVFGKLLNNKRSAETALRLQQDYQQAVQSQIICGVASCYYSIATIQAQLALSRETAAIWKETVQVMKDYKEAGKGNQAAVAQSQAQYMSILANITDLEAALEEANNTFSLLLNEAPRMWPIPADAVMENPRILREGVAMSELARRPDVRAAEEQLAVAYYATNSARAAFYPGITLSSNGGYTNLLGSFIQNPGDWFIQLAGNLTAPLFARGQNIARLKGAKAQQQQAMNNFQYTLLSAAAEVNNYTTALEKATAKAIFLHEQVASLKEAVEATTELMAYTNTTTYLEVLTAQSSLLAAQMGELSTLLAREQAMINLYRALGGAR